MPSLRAFALTLFASLLLPAAAHAAGPATGGAVYEPPPPDNMTVPGTRAKLLPDGTAAAPAAAPAAVQRAIWAANRLQDKPYRYGGGHARWEDVGYDCSGSMSYGLHGAGLLGRPLDSSGFARWGQPGRGEWVTIYANAGHSYMTVAGVRFDTSGLSQDGTRWHTSRRSAAGYAIRHPAGL